MTHLLLIAFTLVYVWIYLNRYLTSLPDALIFFLLPALSYGLAHVPEAWLTYTAPCGIVLLVANATQRAKPAEPQGRRRFQSNIPPLP